MESEANVKRVRRSMPLTHKLLHYGRWIIKPLLKLAVPIFAIWGKYPPLMVTPDDPVSPFGSGTTKGASVEPTQMAIYKRFGRWVGDVIWLGWRNSGYGIAYYLKPDWMKDPKLRYMDLVIVDERQPPQVAYLKTNGDYEDNSSARVGTVWVRQPDGKWLWEKTRKWGPLFVITGYRLSSVASGATEDRIRAGSRKLPPIPRPAIHPNMDGRPIVSIRSARTM
jgi:hypothetical protein